MNRCYLCGAFPERIAVGVRHNPELEVCKCAACGLVYLWPRPSEDELRGYYDRQYRASYDPGVELEAAYRENLAEAQGRVTRLRSLLSEKIRLLEIGAYAGYFLDAVRPYAGSVAGVEPDPDCREWVARRLGIQMEEDVACLAHERFDVVVMFHTLEHLPDPVQSLKQISKVIAPGGKLIIEVPNVDDALISLYEIPAYQNFYYQRAHLFYFSKSALKQVSELAGFNAQITGLQRYDLSNHLRWMLTGQPGGQRFYEPVLDGVVNAAYAEALIRSGRSDTLWAVLEPAN